jgi:histidinol-phosphate aminotransferase
LIQTLSKVRPPFNITTLSMVAAVEALKDQDFVHDSIALHSQEIERYEVFARDHGINYIDSYTNFITYILRDGQSSTQIANRLLEKGVIIRDLASYGMNALRITVGTPIQNDIFFRKYLEVAH